MMEQKNLWGIPSLDDTCEARQTQRLLFSLKSSPTRLLPPRQPVPSIWSLDGHRCPNRDIHPQNRDISLFYPPALDLIQTPSADDHVRGRGVSKYRNVSVAAWVLFCILLRNGQDHSADSFTIVSADGTYDGKRLLPSIEQWGMEAILIAEIKKSHTFIRDFWRCIKSHYIDMRGEILLNEKIHAWVAASSRRCCLQIGSRKKQTQDPDGYFKTGL